MSTPIPGHEVQMLLAQPACLKLAEDSLKPHDLVHVEDIATLDSGASTPNTILSSSDISSATDPLAPSTPATELGEEILQGSVEGPYKDIVTRIPPTAVTPAATLPILDPLTYLGYLPLGTPIPNTTYPWLVASPYIEPEHQLNLTTLDIQNQLLAEALTHLTFDTPDYAIAPYEHALNWPEVFAKLQSLSVAYNHTWQTSEFYVVEFRSKLKPDIENPLLFELDKESHREATESGGLLKYWYGEPDSERRNLATCLWRHKEDAIAGGKGPWHRQARGVISRMYEDINVKGLKLTIFGDVSDWKFEVWS